MNPEATGKVLVTGGAGFLGSHLCERLVSDGRDVVCVDNLYTGSKKNVEHLFNSPRFQFIHHDVQTPLHLDVDQFFNLSTPSTTLGANFSIMSLLIFFAILSTDDISTGSP